MCQNFENSQVLKFAKLCLNVQIIYLGMQVLGPSLLLLAQTLFALKQNLVTVQISKSSFGDGVS